MYHTEGAGGGHAPDLIKSASFMNVLAIFNESDFTLYG